MSILDQLPPEDLWLAEAIERVRKMPPGSWMIRYDRLRRLSASAPEQSDISIPRPEVVW